MKDQRSLQELIQMACRAAFGGSTDTIIQAHSFVKRMAPKSAEARLLSGAVHWVRWHPNKVLKTCQQVVAGHPDTTTAMAAHLFCGLAFLQLAQPTETLRAAEAALLEIPGTLEAEYLKALALVILAECHQALQLLSRWMPSVEEISPPDFGLQLLLLAGRAYTELGEGKQAMDVALRCLRLFPGSPRVYILKGRAHFYLDQYEETVQACDQALALAPDEAEAWMYRAIALTLLGRYEEALPAYTRALLLLPPIAARRKVEVYMAMVLAFQRLGRYQQALKACQAAYAIASHIPMDQETLVNLQRNMTHLQQKLQQQSSDNGNSASPHTRRRLFPFLPHWRGH